MTEKEGADAAANAQPTGEPKTQDKPKPEDQKGRVDRLAAKHQADVDAIEAKHRTEVEELQKSHTGQMQKIKEVLGIKEEDDVDPAERAAEQTKLALGALKLSQFRVIAAEAGIRPDAIDDAFRMVDQNGISVDIGKGTVAGIEGQVNTLLESKPWLKADPRGPSKPAVGGGGVSDERPVNPADSPEIMSDPAKIRENKASILQAVKERYIKEGKIKG